MSLKGETIKELNNDENCYLKFTLRPSIVPMFFGAFCYLMLVLIPSAMKDKGLTNLFTQILTYRQFYDNVSTLLLVLILISGAVTVWALKYTRIILKPTGIVLFSFVGNRSFLRWEQIHSCGIRNFLGLKHIIICIINRKGEKVQFLMPIFLIDLSKLTKAVITHCEPNNPIYRLFHKKSSYNRISTRKMIEYTKHALRMERGKIRRRFERLIAGQIDAGIMAISSEKKILGILPQLGPLIDSPFTHKERYAEKSEHSNLLAYKMPDKVADQLESEIDSVIRTRETCRFRINIGKKGYMIELYPSEIDNGSVKTILATFIKIAS